VWRWDQAEPFGSDPANEDPDANSVAFDLPLRLPGQYYDKETNLHYNYFRDYDPGIGRYVQSDLIGLHGGLNTYAYTGGDPIYVRDPSGLILECKEVFAGYTTRTERIKVREEVSGWVRQCRAVLVGGTPGIPDPVDRSQRGGGSREFPGDLHWEMVCRNEWKVIQPAVWEIRTTILARYYTKCEDKDACPPKSYILGGRYVPVDPAIP
jgi:RHS repeat-associated protein